MIHRPRRLPSMALAARRLVLDLVCLAPALLALVLAQANAFADFDAQGTPQNVLSARSARIAGVGQSSSHTPTGSKAFETTEPSDTSDDSDDAEGVDNGALDDAPVCVPPLTSVLPAEPSWTFGANSPLRGLRRSPSTAVLSIALRRRLGFPSTTARGACRTRLIRPFVCAFATKVLSPLHARQSRACTPMRVRGPKERQC